MEKEILCYKNVSFVRDGRKILDDINWQIKENENWALIGLNGSGKSTLLSMLPAYVFPSSGELWVFENKFGACVWKDVRDKLGFVSSALQNNFSATLNRQSLENIVISGAYNSIGIYQEVADEVKNRAEKIIENFKISYIKDKIFGSLSQGEQRRTLLARAFMNEPNLLILDEPCSGLDITARESFLKNLQEISESEENRKPFIYVSHQIEEIIPAVSHIAILKDGKMIAQGNKKEILTKKFLSQLFELDVDVIWKNERPYLIIE